MKKNISQLPFREIYARILSIDNKVFQVIVVPVKAPRVIAYTVIGFEFDQTALLQLKDLLSLDISLVKNGTSQNKAEHIHLIESSITDKAIKQQALFGSKQQSPSLFLASSEYFHKDITLSGSRDVSAILSVSLIQIQHDFNQLIISILIIA